MSQDVMKLESSIDIKSLPNSPPTSVDIYQLADEIILPCEISNDDLLPLVQETFAVLDGIQNQTDLEHDPQFLMENAKLLEDNGDFELARNIYKALFKKGLLIPDSIIGIAKTLEKEKKYEEAIGFYEEAIAFSSREDIFDTLASLQIKLGKDHDATKTLSHSLGLTEIDENKKFKIHKTLGNCFTRLADFSKAEYHYTRAFEVNPNSDLLQVNVGSLALQKNNLSAALEHFQKAIVLNPKNAKAFCGMGLLEAAKNNSVKAHDYFLHSAELDTTDLGVIYNLVRSAYEIKKYRPACLILEKYIRENPINTNVLYSYAGILYHMDRYEEALVQTDKIFQLNADHTGAKELKELILSKKL